MLTASRLAGGAYLRMLYADGTSFVVDRAGANVWAASPAGTLEDTATYLLGPVLAYVLRLRGHLSLHASAVRVGDCALALVGPQGAGKSTTAAAFAQLGNAILTDDTAVVVEQAGGFMVRPGNPLVRLWDDSVTCLFGTPEALPRLTPTWDKRYLDLRGNSYRFETLTLPLAVIYLLGARAGRGMGTNIVPVSGSAALMALVANTTSNHLLDGDMRARELERVGLLANQVTLRHVTPADDPANVRQLCEAILEDFALVNAPNGRVAADV
ncbi:MAG: serine/threonine protein kinase [Candidatus Koribacter versatilis]|uniref:Serine/threonine protein kinase n=1 Tax=Candidatus Korobacter versatilis TaxID=658062 RepID=A0A932ENU6_9BACT|nr:serine/threonine protein kinase [Candidatus Koribacter versatilis]